MISRIEKLYYKKAEPYEPGAPASLNPQPKSSLLNPPAGRRWNERLETNSAQTAPTREIDLLPLYLFALSEASQPGHSVILLSRYDRPLHIVRQTLLGYCDLDESKVYSGEMRKEHFPIFGKIVRAIRESRLYLPDFEADELWASIPLFQQLADDGHDSKIIYAAPSSDEDEALLDDCRYLAEQTEVPVLLFTTGQSPSPF